jgi:hypothetical protein
LPGETFKEYVDSLSYGSRADLLFKFLKNAPEEAAEQFLQSLMAKLGETVDDGRLERIFDLIYEGQLAAYSPPDEDPRWKYDDSPFAPLTKPVSQARVGLLTSSGHFIEGEEHTPPELSGLSQEEAVKRSGEFGRGKPFLSAIPTGSPREALGVLQPGYDTRAAVLDRDTVFPVDRLKELAAAGVIGELAPVAYSFIGLTSQIRLNKEDLPEWVERVKADGWEAAALVPV